MSELRWPFAEVAAACADALARQEDEHAREAAVRGLDAKDEVQLHPILRDGLSRAGFGAHGEERYPSDRGRTRRNEGRRCDLVVTPRGLALDEGTRAQPGLFDLPGGCALHDALWIEVKCVAQFCESGPNRAYASNLARPVWRDVEKLAAEPGIQKRAVLLLLFTQDDVVADHDVEAWALLGRRRGLPIGSPVVRRVSIGDRWGNRLCTAALFPVSGLAA